MKTWLVEIRTKAWIAAENPVLAYVEVEIVDYADEYNAQHAGFDQYALIVTNQPKVRKHVMDTCKIIGYLDEKSYSSYFCAADAICLD